MVEVPNRAAGEEQYRGIGSFLPYLSHCCYSRLSHGPLQLAQQLAAVAHLALAWSLSSPCFWSQYQLFSLKHGSEKRISSSVAGIWGTWVPSLSSLKLTSCKQWACLSEDHSANPVPVSGSEGSQTLFWVLQLCCYPPKSLSLEYHRLLICLSRFLQPNLKARLVNDMVRSQAGLWVLSFSPLLRRVLKQFSVVCPQLLAAHMDIV